MPGGLTVTAEADQLVLAGTLDGEGVALADRVDLAARARGGRLALDLAGIRFINSLGVRDWIRLMGAAQRAGVAVELRRVAEPLVHQLNMIIAARGAARVASFYAPYACDSCGREDSRLIDAQAHARGLARLDPPAMTCPSCGAAMAFNDFPERYFLFLSV